MNTITKLERLGLHRGGGGGFLKGKNNPKSAINYFAFSMGPDWGLGWHLPLLVSDWTSQMANNYPEV